MTTYFLKQKRRYLFYFSLSAVGVFYLFRVEWMEEYAFGCEVVLALLLAMICCCILENRDEAELIHCTKYRVQQVFYTQLAVLYGYMLLTVTAAQLLAHIIIPCERGAVLWLVFSYGITGLFFVGVSSAVRRLTGSVYVAVGITLFITLMSILLHNSVEVRAWDIRLSFVDVYALSTMYGTKYWIWNRLIFLAAGIALLWIGYRFGGGKDED